MVVHDSNDSIWEVKAGEQGEFKESLYYTVSEFKSSLDSMGSSFNKS